MTSVYQRSMALLARFKQRINLGLNNVICNILVVFKTMDGGPKSLTSTDFRLALTQYIARRDYGFDQLIHNLPCRFQNGT